MVDYNEVNKSFPPAEEVYDNDLTDQVQVVPVPVSSQSATDTEIVPRKIAQELYHHEVTYRCSFYFKPEMLQYYYSPGPQGYFEGKPVLLGSPEFEGGFRTKWQIHLTINKWINTQRWMSLFLTHLDDLSPPDLKVQCEFMIVDTKGNVLYSQRNLLSTISKDETCGMAKFISFKDVRRMISDEDNCIHITARLKLVSQHCHETCPCPVLIVEQNEANSNSTIGIDDISCLDSYLSGTNYNFGIEVDEQVMLLYKGEPVTAVSRSLLKEKSQSYAFCLKEWPDSQNEVNFNYTVNENDEKEKRTLREYAFYIQLGHCKTLEIGSYSDIHILLHFAKKMESLELTSQCVTALTMKLTPWNASVHGAAMIYLFNGQIDKDDKSTFRKYFQENFIRIRKTDSFKKLMKNYIANFVDFPFSPST